MAKAWPSSTASDLMLRHRRAWRTSDPNVFWVYDHAAKIRYMIPLNPFGMPCCPCPGGSFETPCHHAKVVFRRLKREGRLPQPNPTPRETRLAGLARMSDTDLVKRAELVFPGRPYEEFLDRFGRQSLVKTILRYEGYAA